METGIRFIKQKADQNLLVGRETAHLIKFLSLWSNHMTQEKKEWIVCKLPPNHPGGQRKVTGIMFGISPQAVCVTAEEKEIIMNDGYLVIITKGEQYEEAKKNIKKKIKAINSQDKNLQSDQSDIDDVEIENLPETPPVEPTKPIKDMTKKEIVAKLVERGLKEGEDFIADSKKSDLIKLLETLS